MPRAVTVLFLVAACSGPSATTLPGAEGDGGSGGTGCRTDADADSVIALACGGLDCDDADPDVHPGTADRCGDGIDQDCDGIDAPCDCLHGDRRSCWTGDPAQRGVGQCADGVQVCGSDGRWSSCTGAVGPSGEVTCDGLDQSCDGSDGGDLCLGCAGAREVCGNGLDDDCDRAIDPPELCGFTCRGVDPAIQIELACCLRPRVAAFGFRCVSAPDLPDCAGPDRPCLDLDGDPGTYCKKECDGTGCRCGSIVSDTHPVESPLCGFASPCAFQDCDDRLHQPCYSRPPGSLGVGACHGGFADCLADGDGRRAWSACQGEVLPAPEICGNGIDDDCDGWIDEADGATGRVCVRTEGCQAREVCDNGLDDDCDGFVDEACPPRGRSQSCYAGPPSTRSVGACRAGTQSLEDGSWGACLGAVLPSAEVCGDAIDGDCSGRGGPGEPEDPGCCVPAPETCNGLDDDCDGLADEGLLSRCGRCDPSPCFVETFGDLGDCAAAQRSCEQIVRAPGGGITLDPDDGVGETPELLLEFDEYGELDGTWVKRLRILDATTGELSEGFSVPGGSPLPAAIALDGSLWLGRTLQLMPYQVALEHRTAAGELLCALDLGPHGVNTLAPEPLGGTWFVLRSSVQDVLGRVDEECQRVDLAPQDPFSEDFPAQILPATPIALAGRDNLWVGIASLSQLDPVTLRTTYVPLEDAPRGAVAGDPWGHAWQANGVRVDAHGPYDLPGMPHLTRFEGVDMLSPIPAGDGTVWGLSSTSALVHLDPRTAEVTTYPGPDDRPLFTPFLDAHDVPHAVVQGQEHVWRLDPGGWKETAIPVPVAEATRWPFLLSRAHLHRIAAATAHFRQVVDGGTALTGFRSLTWTPETPGTSRVRVWARLFARASDPPDRIVLCAPEEDGAIDLAACAGGRLLRFAEVMVELFAGEQGERPVLRELSLRWDRP